MILIPSCLDIGKFQLAAVGFHHAGTPFALSVWRMKPLLDGGSIP
ncbi:MAG TPA: hypothetical protein VF410_10770 [Rhizomicrobium sp.]|jgi:hypothetical protein